MFRRIPHGTGKKKRPAPVSHGRSEGDFPNFSCHAPAGGAPKSGRLFRQTHSAPGKTPPRQEIDRPHLPAGKFTPQESPQDKPGEGKFPSGGMCPPFSLQQISQPGPAPARQEANAHMAGTQTEALRPKRRTESRYRPSPTEKHVPPGSEHRMCRPPRENAFLQFPAGKAAAFSPCLREENKKKPCRRTQCALKLQGFKRRKAPETGAFPKITLASAYFPT